MKLKIDTKECHILFGKFIRNARNNQGLLQTDVAERLGVSQVHISHFERGERDIDFVLALRLCEVLNVDIDDFIKTICK